MNVNLLVELPDPLEQAQSALVEELFHAARYEADWTMEKMDLSDEIRGLVHYAARNTVVGVLEVLDGNTDLGPYVLLPKGMVSGTDNVPTMTGGLAELFSDFYEEINN